MVWNGCLLEPVWWQITTFSWAALVDVVPAGGAVVIGGVVAGGVVVGGIVAVGTLVTGGPVVTGIVVVIVTVVPVVTVVVTVVVGLTFLDAKAVSFEEPDVTCASATPATAANARPTADATTTLERRLMRGNRLGIRIPSSGTSAYASEVAAGDRNLRRARSM
jgi:hypothetical protein